MIGLGAVPVFLYARRRLQSEAMALVLAGAYLLHPAVGWTNLENFHPDSFLGVSRRHGDLGGPGAALADVRRVRRALAAGEGGRLARDRAARRLGRR